MDSDDIKAKGIIGDKGSRFIGDKEGGIRENGYINEGMSEERPDNLSVEEN